MTTVTDRGQTSKDGAEALALFQALLRIDTSNPPGGERAAADLLARELAGEGIEPVVLESAPSRGSLVARLKGEGPQGPLLLTGHLDVVPAEASRWKHPPFGGEIHDGMVWGRGAVDMKHMVAMSTMVLKRLKREGVRLRRDVIFAAVADEESGCDAGSRFLVEKHPELVKAEYMLGETGGFTLHLGGKRYYPVEVAEKGVAWLKLTARGTPGHGSIPHGDNAVLKLARAVARLGAQRLPRHSTAAAEAFIRGLAAGQTGANRHILPLILRPGVGDVILDRVIPDRAAAEFFRALLHNTACPTRLEAGVNVNVIPGEASAYVDGRTLPGQTTGGLVDEVRRVVGSDIEISVVRDMPPVETQPESELFDRIRTVVAEQDPGGQVVPFLVSGFTDAKQFSRLGARCYGFAPLKLPPGMVFSALFHQHDERIPVDGFFWGLEALYQVVRRFAGA